MNNKFGGKYFRYTKIISFAEKLYILKNNKFYWKIFRFTN